MAMRGAGDDPGGADLVITGVRDVYYNVQDMKRALAFYRDLLGLRVVYESEDWCTLEIGGVHIGLESSDGKPVPRVRGAGATLTLRSTDIREDVSRLRGKGVTFLGPIGDHEWGSVVEFEDPEGNVLKLLQEPD
jgi:catechol 2,3-dioxygenase-like lactoylglutathione lyase family enzyme